MSDVFDNKDDIQSEEVRLNRQRRASEFRLSIKDDEISGSGEDLKARSSIDDKFTDEISSFSDETTRAQIEKESKKELRRQKKEEKKILRIKSGRNKKIYRIAWLCIVIILSIVVSQFLIVGCNDFLAITRTDKDIAVVRITTDDSIDAIADKLKEKNIIDSATFFSLFAGVTGKAKDIEPGVYQVPKNKDYLGVLNYLQNTSNRQTTITLQITEGTNVLDLSKQLYDAGVTYDVDEFLRLCDSDEFDDDFTFLRDIDKNDERIYKLEGYLFPDTYEFYADESPDITIRRFLSNFKTKVFDDEFKVNGYVNPVCISDLVNASGYTLDDIVTISSLIQSEAADDNDMFYVSSVIHNRLDFGAQYDVHSLGLDCTAFYPYKNAQSVPEDIKDTFHSTYETYDSAGLPPGPVTSAGAKGLIAAVAPESSKYLYFCHGVDSDGVVTPYYAVTFDEHLANLSKAGLN